MGQALTLQRGYDLPHRLRREGTVPIVSSSGISGRHSQAQVSAPGIVTGRYGTVGEVFYIEEDFWPLNTTLYVRDFKGNDPRYLSYLLHTIDFQSHSGKSGVPGVNRNDLHQLPVSLPTLAEQRAIAEALSDVDGLIGVLDKLIAKKRAIKQVALQQLLTGKTRLPGFENSRGYESTELGLIPKDWQVQSLREGITLFSGHHVLARYCNVKGEGVPYLTGPADFPNGTIKQTKFTVRPTSLCEPSDILVTVKGSGAGALVEADSVYCISRQLMAIRVRNWNTRFIFYSLLQNSSKLKAASTGLIPGLSRSDILDQELPLPTDIEEQHAIATILSDMDAEIAALERRLDKTKQIKQGMMQQLLTGRVRLVKPPESNAVDE